MDSTDKTRCLGLAILATVSLVAGDSTDKLTPFRCTNDVCNRYGKPQFCRNERCSNCEDDKHLCGMSQMPTNCSAFCWDRTCSPPWNIPNGHVEVSPTIYGRHLAGTILTFVCDEGFELRANNNFTCDDNGQWRPESITPFCIQMSTSSQCVEPIHLAVGIAVPFVVFFAVCIVYICLRRRRLNINHALASTGTEDEIDPLTIANRNDVNTDSTVVEMNMEETGHSIESSDVLGIMSVTDTSHNNEEVTPKRPIQVQAVDEQNNHVCEESAETINMRKLALGENTFDNSDIASNSRL